jgi:hopanoid biosynthesis associated RND transporter like protein HpnN
MISARSATPLSSIHDVVRMRLQRYGVPHSRREETTYQFALVETWQLATIRHPGAFWDERGVKDSSSEPSSSVWFSVANRQDRRAVDVRFRCEFNVRHNCIFRMAAPHSEPESSWLSAPLGWTTQAVVRSPRLVLAASLILAGLAIWVAAWSLQLKTNRLALLNPRSEFQQRWLAYLDEFGDQDDVVIVVEGGEPEALQPAMQELSSLLQEEAWFEGVLVRRDLTPLRRKALHYLDTQQLHELDRFLREFAPLLEGDWSQLEVLHMLQRANDQLAAWSQVKQSQATTAAGKIVSSGESATKERERFPSDVQAHSKRRSSSDATATATQTLNGSLQALAQTLSGPDRYQSPWPNSLRELSRLADRFGSFWQIDPKAKMGFVVLRFTRREGAFVTYGPPLARLREIVSDVQSHYPQLHFGVTGLPVLENDEMEASQSDSTWTSFGSLIGVALIFIAGFGSFRRPLLAVIALLIALAWSFGYVTMAVGHLNILSVSFGVILIGLGIDFGIHYITSYGHWMTEGYARHAALLQATRQVGPGILTGGLTTALSFCTTILTDFTGIVELGLIASGGIVLCILAALTVLPAMLALWDRDSSQDRPSQLVTDLLPSEIWLRRPRLTLLIFCAVTAFVASGLTSLTYDHNLLNLQPQGLESAELSRRLARDQERDVWFAVCQFATPEALLQARDQLDRLEVVGSTEELVTLLPQTDPQRTELIRQIHRNLARLPAQPPLIPVASRGELLVELRGLAAEMGDVLPIVGELGETIEQLPIGDYFQRLAHFQQRAAIELLAHFRQMAAISDPNPPQAADLPPELTTRFLGRQGHHLLRIYARGEIWDMDALTKFVRQVEQVVPHVTGHPVQTFYASRQMQQSYLQAAVYSLIAVCVVLIIDFRSIRRSVLAIVPMLVGFLQMLGLMGWLGIPLNPANMIVLPLILGIGIDDGVHLVHDFCSHLGRYRLSSSTAAAIVFTSATTMVGFGSLMFATHQGLRSLGQVMTLGVLCCLISSLLGFPSFLMVLRTGFSGAADSDKVTDSISFPPTVSDPVRPSKSAAA